MFELDYALIMWKNLQVTLVTYLTMLLIFLHGQMPKFCVIFQDEQKDSRLTTYFPNSITSKFKQENVKIIIFRVTYSSGKAQYKGHSRGCCVYVPLHWAHVILNFHSLSRLKHCLISLAWKAQIQPTGSLSVTPSQNCVLGAQLPQAPRTSADTPNSSIAEGHPFSMLQP